MSFWERTRPRTDETVRYGPEPLTPERIAEIEGWLKDIGPNDRNDPERYVVVDYVEDLLHELRKRDENSHSR